MDWALIQLVAVGPAVAELFDDDGGDDGERSRSRRGGGGREISEVPTCANCKVDCEVEREDQRSVVRNALRRVDESDGGLARMRWMRMGEQMGRRAVGEIKRVPVAAPASVQSPTSLGRSRWSIQGGTRTSHDSHASHLPVDGNLSGPGESGDDERDHTSPPDPVIYVSIFDPFNGPSFKPSPTKPIPKWMRWLPSQRERRSETRPHSILDEYFPPIPVEQDDFPMSKLPTIYPPSPSPNPLYSSATPRPLNGSHASQSSEFGKLTKSTITALKGPSFVLDEPLKRPSSRVAYSTPTSSKAATTEHYVSTSHPAEALLSPRSRTPTSPRRPVNHRPPSPLTEQVAAHLRRFARRTPPAQSREFLNTYHHYQPHHQLTNTSTSPSPSIAVAGREREKGVADGRQVRSILGRNRTPSPRGVGQVVTDAGEVLDARSMRKKSSLQSEIKRFLSGRGLGRE
ncbi:hypothetical protein Daesc_008346 [Daldinia eschscholtzii]|uniref:Uncharacterized protein n=1 Tax=Daldinia eschscholtzii TaxID=292717 RepID=A0AAX6MC26_9PEZI